MTNPRFVMIDPMPVYVRPDQIAGVYADAEGRTHLSFVSGDDLCVDTPAEDVIAAFEALDPS